MNKRIEKLAEQAGFHFDEYNEPTARKTEKFAELIIEECVKQCSQEWYDLNNISTEDLDDRGIAIRVGQKAGVLKAQQRIKKHFGIE